MFKADCHLHTTFSPDGHQTPEELIFAAVAKGLTEITVTEHCECNNNAALPPNETPWPDLDVKAYTETFEQLKLSAPIKINIGIEIGQATQGRQYAERMLNAYNWDFVLGSLHNIRNEFDFYYIDYRGKDIDRLFSDYFEQLYETVMLGGFSVLSHLYYPVRYIYRQGMTIDITKFDSRINDILKLLAQKGLGLEINTSAVFDEYGDFVPGYKYAKMFKQLGGEIVTVGSDSHFSGKVGSGIVEAYEMLKQAGFSAVATFENQKPIFHDIT